MSPVQEGMLQIQQLLVLAPKDVLVQKCEKQQARTNAVHNFTSPSPRHSNRRGTFDLHSENLAKSCPSSADDQAPRSLWFSLSSF